MKSRPLLIIFVGLLALFIACKQVPKEDLIGTWQAVALTEEGRTVEVNLKEIKLSFEAKTYQFESTLQYKEAGNYRLQSNLLLTKDTLQENRPEKGIEIKKLTKDSLFLRMNENGRERRLVMVRGVNN